MAKFHFLCSDEPITVKQSLSACGKMVERLGQVNTDEDLQRIELSSLTGCRKCQANMTGRYLYVGKEIK